MSFLALTNNTSLWRGWNTPFAGQVRSTGCYSESNRVARTFTPKTQKALGKPSTHGGKGPSFDLFSLALKKVNILSTLVNLADKKLKVIIHSQSGLEPYLGSRSTEVNIAAALEMSRTLEARAFRQTCAAGAVTLQRAPHATWSIRVRSTDLFPRSSMKRATIVVSILGSTTREWNHARSRRWGFVQQTAVGLARGVPGVKGSGLSRFGATAF